MSSFGDAVDVVECALCGEDAVVVARKINRQQSDLLEKLAEIAGKSKNIFHK